MYNSEVKITSMKPFGVTGEALDIKGRQIVSFELGGREYKHGFLCVRSLGRQPAYWALLGISGCHYRLSVVRCRSQTSIEYPCTKKHEL
jgi:hypothetical protein